MHPRRFPTEGDAQAGLRANSRGGHSADAPIGPLSALRRMGAGTAAANRERRFRPGWGINVLVTKP